MENKYYYVMVTNIPTNKEDSIHTAEMDGMSITTLKNIKSKKELTKRLFHKTSETIIPIFMPIVVEKIDEKEVRDLISGTAYFIDNNEERKTNYLRVKLIKSISSSEAAKYLRSITDEERLKYTSLINQIKYSISVEYQLDKGKRRKEAIEELKDEEYIRKYKKDNWK